DHVLELVNKLTADAAVNVMGKCGDRIWSGYNWQNLNVALVGQDSITAIEGNQIRQTSAAELKSISTDSTVAFFNLNGTEWMSLPLDDFVAPEKETQARAEALFSLGVHEAFHHVVQPAWVKSPDTKHGTDFPLLAEPRLERRMLFDWLSEAFLNPESA